jgi:hypothetical protein
VLFMCEQDRLLLESQRRLRLPVDFAPLPLCLSAYLRS